MRSVTILLLLLPWPALARAEGRCPDIEACTLKCKQGAAPSCEALGDLLLGASKKKRKKRGLKALAWACTQHQAACFQLGRVLTLQADARQVIRGFEVLEDLCSKKDPRACLLVGSMHEAEGDPADGERFFERMCGEGIAEGCYRLARLRERAGRYETELFGKACAGGVQAACEREIARAWPETWTPAYVRVAAHRFVDECFYDRPRWIKDWTHRKVPRTPVGVIVSGSDEVSSQLGAAVGEAIAGHPSVTLGAAGGPPDVAYEVVIDVDELAQTVEVRRPDEPVTSRAVTHQALAFELRRAGEETICRSSVEIAFVDELPPPPGGATAGRPGCLISEQRVAEIAEAVAQDLVAGAWVARVRESARRRPRLRFRSLVNKTSDYLDLAAMAAAIERRVATSRSVEVLPRTPSPTGAKVADVVGILHVESCPEDFRSTPANGYRMTVELVDAKTGEIVWLTDRLAHLCPLPGGEICTLTGATVRAMADELAVGAASSRWYADQRGERPTVRLRRVVNLTDEHINFATAVQVALALDGGFTVLASPGAELAAVTAEQDLWASGASSGGSSMIGEQRSGAFVMTSKMSSVMEQTDEGRVRHYRLNAELIDATNGDKVWIGDREETLLCPKTPKNTPTW